MSLPIPRSVRWLAGGWRPAVLAAVIGSALVAVGAMDYLATRREFMALVRTHGTALGDAVTAAALVNHAASEQASAQLADRLLDNARLLAKLDARGALTAETLADLTTRNHLFRVTVFAADGTREHQASGELPGGEHAAGPPLERGSGVGRGPGPGAGPRSGQGRRAGQGPGAGLGLGPGGGQIVERLLSGGETEVLTAVHTSRMTRAARLAAGVRRSGGGAIVIGVDASAVADLQRQSSLAALLDRIARDTPEVAYVAMDEAAGDPSTGAAEPASPRLFGDPVFTSDPRVSSALASDARAPERELVVGDKGVLEVSRTVRFPDGGDTRVRVGMRLDAVRSAERRTLARLAISLTFAVSLGGLALGLVWLRRRYGTLAERHAAAEAALRQRDRLASMGELGATVAHEIRNPLNAIAMSAQRLEAELQPETVDPETRGLAGIIQREARRLNGIVQQFLDFARPPALVPVETAVAPWLDSIVASAAPGAAARGVALVAQVDVAGSVRVDPERLRDALDNVIRNAIEATPPGGEVRVAAGRTRDGLRIEVADTGTGIPEDVRARIFDLYFTTKSTGTGVGLAMTHQAVNAHHGTIEVLSAVGAGTTIRIHVPDLRESGTHA